MTIHEDANSKFLLDLLYRIHSGNIVLADFQRDSACDPSVTKSLIVSIANNYPTGTPDDPVITITTCRTHKLIDERFEDHERFVNEVMTIEPAPYLKVVAVIHREA